LLQSSGGHAGDDQQHAAIRRWTAAKSGFVQVQGTLRHPSESGDGVRSRIVSSRAGLMGQWTTKTNSIETNVTKIEVQPGDTLDFVTDCQESVNSDSFEWPVQLRFSDTTGNEPETWDSSTDFHGPLTVSSMADQIAAAWRLAYCRPVTSDEMEFACQFVEQQMKTLRSSGLKGDHELIALTNLCQQIISSNEFLYVD
jgi:hypothetical protein